jgi:23S rRNA (guanosine2251-2'-O)-methyltransferase
LDINFIKYPCVAKTSLFVLGNETTGISEEVRNIANATLNIPLMNGVESLNVAVSAAVTAFMIQDGGSN